MTYGHLQADCLYTGISSGPNARCRVWEAFTFLCLRRQASVRYVLRAKLDSTNASLRQMCRDCGFVVSRPLDLNQIASLDSATPRHWTSAAAAYVDDQLPPVDVS